MPKDSIRDNLEGNELDLSLSNLTVVPVKEMLQLRKATHIDMSCNLLSVIPDDFVKMEWIVKLDLSKNNITRLPEDIGNLQKLQHLDLFKNKLQALPVSMCHLKSLKWLDVKDNPLDETMKKVAGDCLDDLQCKTCAKRVVVFMKDVQSEQERKRQKRLQEQRELDEKKKIEDEKLRQQKKLEKAAEKERKRKIFLEEQEKKRQEELEAATDQYHDANETKMNGHLQKSSSGKTGGLSCCGILFGLLFGLIAIFASAYVYCEVKNTMPACVEGRVKVMQYIELVQIKTLDLVQHIKDKMK
ncbi:unnamed protein product [Owenia fusiformis]|uniref:Disease resistance R13L4/SHOC-2-like LRR domain-containing protein n=1 Tax=Owenia fusiformis TaxID=6347 RepID=A0A8J1TGE2_OWEFU|nr:unnamed protein product [Owenia fusiformis]